MELYIVTRRTESREWGEMSFEVEGVWQIFDKALEYLQDKKKKRDDLNKKLGDSETERISGNDHYACWCYSDWDGHYLYKIESVEFHEL